jgi:heme-degrading monooxygenase HmoA
LFRVLCVTSAISAVKVFKAKPTNMLIPNRRNASFVIIWEFRIQATKRRTFERAYAPDGTWANFFRKGKGYIATELIRDSQQSDRYITLDYWQSRQHYENFKKQNGKMYQTINEKCESLTTRESEIGQFTRRIKE